MQSLRSILSFIAKNFAIRDKVFLSRNSNEISWNFSFINLIIKDDIVNEIFDIFSLINYGFNFYLSIELRKLLFLE